MILQLLTTIELIYGDSVIIE